LHSWWPDPKVHKDALLAAVMWLVILAESVDDDVGHEVRVAFDFVGLVW
jgi:hypothetical protein